MMFRPFGATAPHASCHNAAERTPHFVETASAVTLPQAFTNLSQESCQRHFRTGS